MNYYERHIGDYLKDTAHLSLLEHGVYARLLDVYYTREGALPEAEAARLIGARSKEERAAVADVLAEFFVLTAGVWAQSRCDAEIERFHDKQEKARRSAEARWSESGRNANASQSADAKRMRTHTEGNALQTPYTSTKEANASSVAASSPPRAVRKCPKAFEPIDPQAWVDEHTPGVDWQHETEKFRDHTFKNAISDWLGAWRNWMRRSFEDLKPRSGAAVRSFRERDADVAADRMSELTGGLASAKRPQGATVIEAFDANPTARLVG